MPTVLITGANRGIGLSLVQQLVARGDDVIGACRTPSPDLTATGAQIESLDVTSDADCAALAMRLAGKHIDVLVLNAGVLERNALPTPDFDSMRRQYEVNALGPLRVATALLPNLAAGSKIAIVSSRVGSIGDNHSGGHYGYRMSKAAVNIAGKSLSIDLFDHGIAVRLLHPGWVRTEMTHGSGNWGPDEAASGLIARIDELNLATTGMFVHADGTELPW
jgi:NAD(P)-dependent dehydrogenase (short-subunit alcohol dehydrogenase family)